MRIQGQQIRRIHYAFLLCSSHNRWVSELLRPVMRMPLRRANYLHGLFDCSIQMMTADVWSESQYPWGWPCCSGAWKCRLPDRRRSIGRNTDRPRHNYRANAIVMPQKNLYRGYGTQWYVIKNASDHHIICYTIYATSLSVNVNIYFEFHWWHVSTTLSSCGQDYRKTARVTLTSCLLKRFNAANEISCLEALMAEAVSLSETQVSIYQSTSCKS
jgi:hypothetical protein